MKQLAYSLKLFMLIHAYYVKQVLERLVQMTQL